jgi:hypothetical protein
MKINFKQKIVMFGVILSLPLSYLNALQEEISYFASTFICLWSMVPFIVLFAYMKEPYESKKKDLINIVVTVFGTGIGVFAYFFYYFAGSTDPNTAAHMHVGLFPIIHLFAIVIFGISFGALTSIYLFFRKLKT